MTCNDHPASTSEILKISFKALDFDDFGHIPLIGSVSLEKTCQLNQRGLERRNVKPRPAVRKREKRANWENAKHAREETQLG